MNLVTIAVFNTAFDAHIAQGSLREEGIECYIKDENTVQINPLYNIAIGGIKLQVAEIDVERAVTVLRAVGTSTVLDTVVPVQTSRELVKRFFIFLGAVFIALSLLYYLQFGTKLPG